MKNVLWIFALVASLTFGQVALASHGCRDGLQKMVDALNLTADQKAKVQPILDQLKSGMKDNFVQMQGLRDQIKAQVESPNMDKDLVSGLVDKQTAMIGNAMKAKVAAKNQIYNLLTDAQKAEYKKVTQQWAEKMAEKWKSCHDND